MKRHFLSRGVQGVIEEGLEIVGTTCLLIAFTEFLRTQLSEAHLPLKKEGKD